MSQTPSLPDFLKNHPSTNPHIIPYIFTNNQLPTHSECRTLYGTTCECVCHHLAACIANASTAACSFIIRVAITKLHPPPSVTSLSGRNDPTRGWISMKRTLMSQINSDASPKGFSLLIRAMQHPRAPRRVAGSLRGLVVAATENTRQTTDHPNHETRRHQNQGHAPR